MSWGDDYDAARDELVTDWLEYAGEAQAQGYEVIPFNDWLDGGRSRNAAREARIREMIDNDTLDLW